MCEHCAAPRSDSPTHTKAGVSDVLAALPLPTVELVRHAVLATCGFLYALRLKYEWYILMWHEVFTGVSADVLAQSIEGLRPSINWARAVRTTSVSFLSDDLPFLVWSRVLWTAAERAKAAVRSSSLSPELMAALTSHASITCAKTAVTTGVYDTASDAVYLALQAALRGGGARGIAAELRAKLWTLRRDGLVFWSMAHMALFSIPVYWMQPIADNLTTIIFNTYQSLLAHQPLEHAVLVRRDSPAATAADAKNPDTHTHTHIHTHTHAHSHTEAARGGAQDGTKSYGAGAAAVMHLAEMQDAPEISVAGVLNVHDTPGRHAPVNTEISHVETPHIETPIQLGAN